MRRSIASPGLSLVTTLSMAGYRTPLGLRRKSAPQPDSRASETSGIVTVTSTLSTCLSAVTLIVSRSGSVTLMLATVDWIDRAGKIAGGMVGGGGPTVSDTAAPGGGVDAGWTGAHTAMIHILPS